MHQTPTRHPLPTWACTLPCAMLLAVAPAGADDFFVDSTADMGTQTLRQGITDSNDSGVEPNTITFSLPDASTIELDSPLSSVTQNLVIDGSTAIDLLVSGDGTTVYEVDPGKRLSLIDAPFDDGDLVLGNGARIFFQTNEDQEVDQIIRGALAGDSATLAKSGAGILRLTGVNTYNGATSVEEGTLIANSLSLPEAQVTVQPNTLLVLDQVNDGTFAGDIGGDGSFEKNGIGVLTLEGENDYRGGTVVRQGTLEGTNDGTLTGDIGAITGDVVVSQDAVLDIGVSSLDTDVYRGALSGAGRFDKSGPGTLVLDPTEGTNSISNTSVLSGVLQGATIAIPGNVDISSPGTLTFDEDGTATYGGILSGVAGSNVIKDGIGQLTLSGVNSFDGLTTVMNGTLVGTPTSITGDVAIPTANAVLAFDGAANGIYSGVVSGLGDFEKRGGGTLEIDAAHSFSGTTRVVGGRLDVTGSLASTAGVDVSSGATLGGSGSIAGAVATSGTIAPGQSFGTLTVDSVTFASGSSLEVELGIDPVKASDLLVVTNTANLSGGTLRLRVDAGTYNSETFTVLTAGTLNGQLAFSEDFWRFDVTPNYVGNSLQVTLDGNGASFSSAATTRNQLQVAESLDAEEPTATPDMQVVMDALSSLPTSEIAPAYDTLGGEQISQFATARFELGDRLDRSMLRRLYKRTDALLVPPAASDRLPAVSSGADSVDTGFWLEPFGIFGGVDGRQGSSEFDYQLAGVTLGGDFSPLTGTRVGAAFSYGHIDLDYDTLSGGSSGNSYFGALYGGWNNDWIRVGLTSRLGYSDMETDREITIGSLQRHAKADFDGLDVGGRLEAGLKLLRSDQYLIEPFVSITYVHLERSQVNESGADSVNLNVDREKLDSAVIGAGLRMRGIFRIDRDVALIPELRSEWNQQLADHDRRVDASFQDAIAGSSFTVRGTELQRNAGLTSFGWTVRSNEGLDVYLGYEIGYDADRVAHGIGMTITAAF